MTFPNLSVIRTADLIGTLYGQQVKLHVRPETPPAVVTCSIRWGDYGVSFINNRLGVQINLSQTAQQTYAQLDAIRSVKIDNSYSGVPVFLQFSDTKDVVTCPAFSIIQTPVLTNGLTATLYGDGFTNGPAPVTTVQFFNGELEPLFIPGTLVGVLTSIDVFTFTTIVGSTNINVPASAQAGDVGLLWDVASGAGAMVPAGWTGLIASGSNFPRMQFSGKVLVPGDIGAPVAGIVGGNKVMIIVRGNVPLTGFLQVNPQSQVSSAPPANQTTTSATGVVPLIVVGSCATIAGNPAFSGAVSPAYDSTIPIALLRVGYKVYNAAPVDQTTGMADQGENNLASSYIQFTG